MNLDQSTWISKFQSDENAVILDVRTPEEFETSRIPNSKNIDFYNPQNILVIDPNNIKIPTSFVESPYVDIPKHILDPYRIDNWVRKVFELED